MKHLTLFLFTESSTTRVQYSGDKKTYSVYTTRNFLRGMAVKCQKRDVMLSITSLHGYPRLSLSFSPMLVTIASTMLSAMSAPHESNIRLAESA